MSISVIKNIFENLHTCDSWSLQILQIKNSKRSGTTYFAREITLSPDGSLNNFLAEISDKYCSSEGEIDAMFEDVIDYDGSTIAKRIYKLSAESELIVNQYERFIDAIGNPDCEVNPFELSACAYVIRGFILIDNEETPIKLIAMQNPVTVLKNKFIRSKGTFKKISSKVISLKTSIDIVIIDNVIYMLTLAGEKLFNMDRAYKAVCDREVSNIIDANIINNIEEFNTVAKRGHNPRKFISFNKMNLQKLRDINNRRKISEIFKIPLDDDKFDVSEQSKAEKLIKVLCSRGMMEPFDNNPMEVAGSKKWE